MPRFVANPASAVGEEVGRLIAEAIGKVVEEVSSPRGFKTKVRQRLRNRWGSSHEIDIVVCDEHENPLILIDVKYLRYKKHCRDKASRTCTAHSSLRETFGYVEKTIAILAGNWTEPSKEQMRSYGIEVYEIPFAPIAQILAKAEVPFKWHEKDRETPQRAWEAFQSLDQSVKAKTGEEIVAPISDKVKSSVIAVLNQILHRRVGRK